MFSRGELKRLREESERGRRAEEEESKQERKKRVAALEGCISRRTNELRPLVRAQIVRIAQGAKYESVIGTVFDYGEDIELIEIEAYRRIAAELREQGLEVQDISIQRYEEAILILPGQEHKLKSYTHYYWKLELD